MMDTLKLLLTLSVAHACWLAWLAVHNQKAYGLFIEKTGQVGSVGYIAKARCWLAWLTVFALAMIALKFALSFLPYDWGKWEDGKYTPASDGLAGMAALFISYLVCLGVHSAGMRDTDISAKTAELSHDIQRLQDDLKSETLRANRYIKESQDTAQKAEKDSDNRLRSLRTQYSTLDHQLSAMRRELVRLKNRVSPEVLSVHEENEKVEREKEAAAPKSRVYYS